VFDLSVEGLVQIFEQVLVPDLLFPVGLHRVVVRLALGFDARIELSVVVLLEHLVLSSEVDISRCHENRPRDLFTPSEKSSGPVGLLRVVQMNALLVTV
jgi:hypothetical protein